MGAGVSRIGTHDDFTRSHIIAWVSFVAILGDLGEFGCDHQIGQTVLIGKKRNLEN